ncbi:LTA synthase family protein [Pseudoalteromonas sp. YIC-827]|uniref:LTA synthase family protein n=1 Tax=Pseudoalteromonas qingdaonensis TaxID=3131913 RepID=A0ABU9MWW0_9GAMM
MKAIKHFVTQVKPLILFVLLIMSLLILSRLALYIWLDERIGEVALKELFVGGLRIDLSTTAYLSAPLLILLTISSLGGSVSRRLLKYLVPAYCALAVMLITLVEAATPAFIAQYDVRPNRLFVEYLIYPQEVLSMLVNGHLLTLIVTTVVVGLAGFFGYRLFARTAPPGRSSPWSAVIMGLVVFPLVALGARGTLTHRPLNPALVYFSQDALVNSLVLNSAYSIAFALKNIGSEQSAAQLYGQLTKEEVLATVKSASYRTEFLSQEIPTLAVNPAYNQGDKKNLVIVLEESLGARFVGALNGRGITPRLDKLYDEGWGFEHLYATGTRSVRGIEAVTTGFLPSPSRSVVKLSKSQQHFATLAQVLTNQGYRTQFIYGGESHFDNMKSFFLGNGVEDIVDFDDIDSPEFVSSWGASDADLFRQADKELSILAADDKPFFSLIFTSSNHDPFAIPSGKVQLPADYQGDNPARDKAIMYADLALGDFIETAKSREYWQNTVFLIVADHDVRVFGKEPVPIKSFHIPALILNSDMPVQRDTRLVSQIDLPVTLMSLLGVEAATPMTGLDLTRYYPVERALMQYYDNYAYVENNEATILMPGNKVSYWVYDKGTKKQLEIAANPHVKQLEHKALAHVLFSSMAYQQGLFSLPKE